MYTYYVYVHIYTNLPIGGRHGISYTSNINLKSKPTR